MSRTALETSLMAQVRERRGSTSIPRRDPSVAARPSSAQLRLWLLDRLTPGSPEYVIPCVFRMRGSLDVAALESAFRGVVQRHEVLRTRFDTMDGEPVQVIDAHPHLTVRTVDVSGEPEADERERAALAAVETDAALGFDLAADHPLRVTVVRLDDAEHLLLVSLHHIAADGWSMEILARELRTLYEAALSGRPAVLADLPVQYADYAAWQRDQLTHDLLERRLGYWRERLAGLEPLELPADRARPPRRSGEGDSVEFSVPPSVARQLADIAAAHRTSPFMAALAAFQVVLSRWSGQDDVVVGTPIAGRTRAESEALIGFFVNTLVLRTDTSGDPTFAELLGRVRETALGAYAHQDLPFERLVEELAPERDLSRSPLFQVSFVYQNVAEGRWELPGVTAEPVTLSATTSKFDLSLSLSEGSDGRLHGEITFSTQLFERATADRMAAHCLRVLEQVAADPGRRIGQLDLLTEAERHQILSEWNDTAAEYPRHRCIHQLVEQRAAASPDAVAVAFEDVKLTYRELNERANELAHHLRALGVRPEVLVGICLERGPEMIVGMLAILKAGGAYVPLDPAYPAERLALMLEDTASHVVVTQSSVADRLPAAGTRRLVRVDADRDAIAARPSTDPTPAAGPDDLAYVIYTSGSTGTPKGVQVRHRNVVCRTWEMRQRYALTADDKVLQFASISFDSSVEQIFPALTVGASLVVRGKDFDPEEVLRVIRRHGVTVMQAPPSVWGQILSSGAARVAGSTLRAVILAGEAASPGLLAKWFEHSRTPVFNAYGPSETTVTATTALLRSPTARVPIGRPIANTDVYVMDRFGRPVPVGVPGELWIGGEGVAQGYLNRPELTAERFVPHPYSDDPAARVYRTGDVVRWLPDGELEFIGRIDRQVKLRGLRIELGEVESVLTRHESVAASVVVVREEEPGDQRLVAYCVPVPGQALDPVALRQWCLRDLPAYMTPGYFIAIDALPQTPSGKVDHRALPRPRADRSDLSHGYVAPRTDAEKLIADAWADILGQNRIGIHDNFFELGGHSLLANRLVNRMRARLGLEVTLRELFEHPTVAGLGTALQDAEPARPALRPRH